MSVLTFGEIMMRVNPPGFLRFQQAMPGSVDVSFAGAEANVAASLAHFGDDARFVCTLPRHAVVDALLAQLRSMGVDISRMHFTDRGRLGVYYLEKGANQRASQVIYDRAGASIAVTPPEDYDFDAILGGADWVHPTGIPPAVGEPAYRSSRRRTSAGLSTDLSATST